MIWNLLLNHIDDVGTVGLLVGGWAIAKLRGKKTQSLKDRLVSIGRQFMPQLLPLLGDPKFQEKARANLHLYMFQALSRLGVKPSKLTDVLIDQAVDIVSEDLAQYVWEHGLDQFVKVQEKTLGVLKSLQ